MKTIFHFANYNNENIKNWTSKYASTHSDNYDSYINNNVISIYDINKNIILEKNIYDIDVSLLEDEIKEHVIMTLKHKK